MKPRPAKKKTKPKPYARKPEEFPINKILDHFRSLLTRQTGRGLDTEANLLLYKVIHGLREMIITRDNETARELSREINRLKFQIKQLQQRIEDMDTDIEELYEDLE